jgi:branched-chain amino acid transport system ATP-binding protein
MLLSIRKLNVFYDAIHALQDISFDVEENQIVTLIGANGAGKSTTLKAISGIVPAKSGSILFNGNDILTLKAHQIVSLGIAHVPEGRRVFAQLSVRENLILGSFSRKDKDEIDRNYELVLTRFPRLKERLPQKAGTLSGGEQQMLAIGRGLMANPKLLLLDEPSMGLSPILVEEIYKIISEINSTGVTILLVEQNAQMALSVAQWANVIETGRIVISGASIEVQEDPAVRRAYLGEHAI